jgi:hypothetical protein
MGNQAIQQRLLDRTAQAKLTVNQPGDRFEQEADRVADQIMRMQDPTTGGAPKVQRTCSRCEEELHRQAGPGTGAAGAGFEHPTGGGRPLPDSERRFFEPRFGRNLGQVRLHTDARASAAARSINALAYTMRNDIVFANGQYRPGSAPGRRLLAHELAHTIQQEGAAEPVVHRRIGDGHDLKSARFARDRVLEAVYDNQRVLKSGDKAGAVRKLQRALVDAGFLLPRFGVDGDFGPETEAAVMAFQRASGLIDANVDGIVGPTTMGWLDQRFSEGASVAGTTPGATPGCPAITTMGIDLVSLDGSTRDPMADLAYANSVFNQCCIRFTLAGGGSEDAVRSSALLGGDTDLLQAPTCGHASAEETDLFTGASADLGLSSPIRVFYVASLSTGDRANSIPAFCATGGAAGLSGMASVSNSAVSRTLAHELGHILLNSGEHRPLDTDNLMHPSSTATGDQLLPEQCVTI